MINILTAQEAANFLRIKTDTLYSLVDRDSLPGAKIGNQWRFIEEDLIHWLRSKSQAAAPKQEEKGAGEQSALVEIYQKFLDATFDAVFLTRDRVIIDCNDITLELYGYSRDDLINQSTQKLMAPEFHDATTWASTVDRTGILQTVCLRANGTAFPVEISVKTVFYDRQGDGGQHCLRITAVRNIADFGQDYWTELVRDVLRNYTVQSVQPGIARDDKPGR
ncbi:MAG: helix-turn-helix domain-containing protein [Alphaproteobacteria bacterium]|nr:helix-turn-helix domain-containing protein [Alphaproteobacteria bacterium]